MKSFHNILITCLVLGLALCLPGQTAFAKMVKKIDNFVILLDQSGSMGQRMDGQKKIVSAVDVITRLDQAIPELGYNGSMYLGSPTKVASVPATYRTGPIASAAKGVDTDFEVFGRKTSLGDDIGTIGPAIDKLSGKTALIVVTDGDNNRGADPLAAARALYERNKPNLCVHVISYADTANGKAVVDGLRALSDCSVAADAGSLASESDMAQYAKAVFYNDVPVAAAPPPPGDADGDGVTDDKDQCPTTEHGVLVDAVGCDLKYTLQIEFDFDKAEIRPQYHEQIAGAAAFIKRYPQTKILIAGHTDNVGAADYNKTLSMQRAEALKNYLVEKFSIGADQLFPRGYGELRPVASNDTDAGRQRNRRVEFICCSIIPPE